MAINMGDNERKFELALPWKSNGKYAIFYVKNEPYFTIVKNNCEICLLRQIEGPEYESGTHFEKFVEPVPGCQNFKNCEICLLRQIEGPEYEFGTNFVFHWKSNGKYAILG